MATTPRFRRSKPRELPLRVLTASSRRLDLNNKTEAKQLKALRQGWQADAWNYRDSVTELRYAIQFLAWAASRMRLFVGFEPVSDDPEQKPVPLADAQGLPGPVTSIAAQGLASLARSQGDRRRILKGLSTNISVSGECYMLGQEDPQTGTEWSIRSLDEIAIKDEGYELREIPDGPQGIIPWVQLDPSVTVLSRIWMPHPRFSMLADGPLRSMLAELESLLILRRMIRAEGRSRLNRGVLKVPDELSIKVPLDDDEDPEADPFMGGLAKALMEPIGDEGVASAYAPIVVRGPADALDKLTHLSLTQPFEEQAQKAREELVGVIATGFDLPKEIITGMMDANHWTAWQIDDNTFRHHIEPHVIELCDALTGAYLRPYLLANDVPVRFANRLVVWYDPTELVTHPDQTKDGLELHDRLIISDEAMLRIAGFGESDRPSKQEVQVRLLEKMRTWPSNLVMAFLHAWDPTLVAPPITVAGTIPGIKPGGVDSGEPPAGVPPAPPAGEAPIPAVAPPAAKVEPAVDQPEQGPPPITASGAQSHRLSRKLAEIDRDLRARLQTAANAAMLRRLDRVGARLRSRVAKDETLRAKILHRPNERVPAILGKDAVTAAGVGAEDLMGNDWGTLKTQFYDWTEAAQQQAIQVALRIGELDAEDDAVRAAEAAMATGRDAGWDLLSGTLTNLGHHLLYNPDPNAGPGEWADLNPDTLVPTGMIRGALGVAGGGDAGVIPGSESTITLGEPIGQIGTGSTITELLTAGGAETDSYEWNHGPSLQPFEPHLDLDGVQFATFDSEALANSSGFPANAYYFPGDHQGCTCDFTPLWVQAETSSADGGEQEAS